MTVIFIQHDPLDILPPLISVLRLLSERGHKIHYIGMTESPAARAILDELGVSHDLYPFHCVRFREHPVVRIWQGLTRRVRPYILRIWVWRRINQLTHNCSGSVVLWAQSFLSAAIMGQKALDQRWHLTCTLYELGDEKGKELLGFDFRDFYQKATLVECEYNRAHILMAQKDLPRLPFVLPNKPYPHPGRRNLPISDARAREIVMSWGNRKVFLYQGAIQSDRGDLFKILEMLCRNFQNIVVAVMGTPNESARALAQKFPNFCIVPRVSPPHHLEVTSHAHVGLAVYKGGALYGLDSANAVYCAPNKIFEYAGFGLPMLCNDIPGLRYSVGLAKAGECVVNIDEDSVSAAARKILAEYDEYSRNAKMFFDSVDTPKIVSDILDFTRGGM